MRKKNHNNRLSYENMLRKLAFEANKTPFKDAIDYLTDNELLVLINGFLNKLGLITYTTNELKQTLSLKNYLIMNHLKHEQEDYFNILNKDGVNVFASDDNKNILICNFNNEILLQVSIDMFKNESFLIVKEHN